MNTFELSQETAVDRLVLDNCRDLPEIIVHLAAHCPDRDALIFIRDGDNDSVSCSYAELLRASSDLSEYLIEKGFKGQRLLLLLPSSLEYVTAFIACLMANVIAVPLYPPRNNWHDGRLAAIANDADAVGVITFEKFSDTILSSLEKAGALHVHSVIVADSLAASKCEMGSGVPDVDGHDIAYLQYTSGSTGSPKGVVVRQADLVGNARLYSAAIGLQLGDVAVSWLPLFHDMGLVQGIVMPLVVGGTAVFMPPPVFIQKPIRWLRAISDYGAVFTGGPNFAYELCVKGVDQDDVRQLDLSSLRVGLNAAEPISSATVAAFAEKFSVAGLHRDALVGGYGMAETTLYVTAGIPGSGAPVLHLDKVALGMDRVSLCDVTSDKTATLVSSGVVMGDPQVCIVNPHTRREVEPFAIGEIWVAGSTVCTGYWSAPEASAETFHNSLNGDVHRHFLRTGDLGFVHDGHLYVTGRLKDLIIIRGANYYPQDIERDVETVHSAFRAGGFCAAFTLDDVGSDQLIVVQEVKRTERRSINVDEAGRSVARLVAASHGIELEMLVLVEPVSIPKTSSGKIQRKACRQRLLDGELKEIGRWCRPAQRVVMQETTERRSRFEIEALLAELICKLTGLPVTGDGYEAKFSDLGMDSVKLVQLTEQIGRMLDISLSPTELFEYPTISLLADHLAGISSALADASVVQSEAIAVVGMACRFPGAEDLDQFWTLLSSGECAVDAVSLARQSLTGYRAGLNDPHRFFGEISDVDRFDAALFGIAPREAVNMDPQQRLMLEVAWHALEHANIAPDSLSGSQTGVFVGISTNDYFRLQGSQGCGYDEYSGTGGALSVTANRLSYCLGLQGPSLALDTACSSSLVAVHQACLSLAVRESNLALVGGVNLVLSDEFGGIFTKARMLSPSGSCKTFDDRADGYVRGEGCGAVVLKRLCDAQRDGDRVLAVIRGSAVNQDGRSNGLTAPNGLAQRQVIRSALARAGCAPDSIGFVETHGTGTPLGDPIEVEAIKGELGTAGDLPCWLGAVKTQIGHLESAAGIAGLIKTVLALGHKQIPANSSFQSLNRHIDLQGSRLQVPAVSHPWSAHRSEPRRAGVSAFGFGGTNVHVIVEEYNRSPANEIAPCAQPLLLLLAARSATSLHALAQLYATRLENSSTVTATAVCVSASRGRAQLRDRLAVVADDPTELVAKLSRFAADRSARREDGMIRNTASGKCRIAFMFTGQGAQYVGMGQALYESEALFRAHLDRCDAILRPVLDIPLETILFGAEGSWLRDTRYAQPALVALEIGMARLWQHYGVEPDWLLGHSVGEYAAACVAGILSLEQVLPLVAERGRLMASAPGEGAMLSVMADGDTLEYLLARHQLALDIAGYNAAGQTVLSGSLPEIEAATSVLDAADLSWQRLDVSHAFHSRLMEPILSAFQEAVASVSFNPPRIPLLCTSRSAAAPDDPAYWVEQLREPVCFAAAVTALQQAGADTFIEIGPGATLIGLGRRTIEHGQWIASQRAGSGSERQWRIALGEAYVAGACVRLPAASVLLDKLPLYPFDRQSFWFERAIAATSTSATALPSVWPGCALDLPSQEMASFIITLPAAEYLFLNDHQIDGRTVFPAAGYLSLIIAAAKQAGFIELKCAMSVTDLAFQQALFLDAARPTRVQILIRREGEAQVFSNAMGTQEWVLHARARVATADAEAAAWNPVSAETSIESADFYTLWHGYGMAYGPAFQAVQRIDVGGGYAEGTIMLPVGSGGVANDDGNTVLLDAAFQVVGGLLQIRDSAHLRARMAIPVMIDAVRLYAPLEGALRVVARARELNSHSTSITADLQLFNADGQLVGEIDSLRLALIERQGRSDESVQLHRLQWIRAATTHDIRARVNPWLIIGECEGMPTPPGAEVSRLSIADTDAVVAWLAERFEGLAEGKTVDVLLVPEVTVNETPAEVLAQTVQLCINAQRLLLRLVQLEWAARLRLCWVTYQAQGPDSEAFAAPNLAHAGVLGMLRASAVEYPTLKLSLLDLPARPAPDDWTSGLRVLQHSDEVQLSVRNGQTWVPRLRQQAMTDRRSRSFGDSGSYLITGGLGGLGLTFCEWLVERGARHLVLVGRRATNNLSMPPRLQALRDRGVAVVLAQADVGQAGEVDSLVERFGQEWPSLRGVIHAAGTLDDRPLSDLDDAAWVGVMRGKCLGAMFLDQATRGYPLEFFMLFSSIASVLGSAGQANYAAANALLDAVAQQRRQAGETTLLIHWGPWAEIGMASSAALVRQLRQLGLTPMSAGAALHAFEQLSVSGDQGLVMACDPQRLLATQATLFRSGLWRDVFAVEVAATPPMPHSDYPQLDELSSLEPVQALQAIARVLLGMTVIVLRQPALNDSVETASSVRLSDLGLDSLMAMDLRNRVRIWAGVDLPAHLLISGGNIGEIANLIYEQILFAVINQTPAGQETEVNGEEVFVL